MTTRIRFQSPGEALQYGHTHPTLRDVVAFVVGIWPAADFDVNEIYRPPSDPNYKAGTPHCTVPHRALDAHTNGVISTWKALATETLVNEAFIYDPARPDMRVAIVEGLPGRPLADHAYHLHLQVHPATRRRVPGDGPQPSV